MKGAEDSIEILEGVEVGLYDLVFGGKAVKFPAFAVGDDAVNVDRAVKC